jgi:hypothetical protein
MCGVKSAHLQPPLGLAPVRVPGLARPATIGQLIEAPWIPTPWAAAAARRARRLNKSRAMAGRTYRRASRPRQRACTVVAAPASAAACLRASHARTAACESTAALTTAASSGYTCHPTTSVTGAGGDIGIDHRNNWLRFPYDSTFLRSHYLHPHPY